MVAFDNLTARRPRPEHTADAAHAVLHAVAPPDPLLHLRALTERLRQASEDVTRAEQVVDAAPTSTALMESAHALDEAYSRLQGVHVQHSLALAELVLTRGAS